MWGVETQAALFAEFWHKRPEPPPKPEDLKPWLPNLP
jgi:hypothetical protein